MGKSLPFTGKLQELTKIASSHQPKRSKAAPLIPLRPRQVRVDSQPLKVVSLCAKRWFQDTLREANAGDIAMQVLVGQMYYSGYGVQKNAQKGCEWINRASKSRASVWKVSDKHPGYNASDSDSDEAKREANNSR
ncbi:hypothetical protein GH714_037420 [Hevea brasiliensis]|uniref:Uncharacterized protein n=1 Tax=Hevea brasiliensis TaxID=3981 RepID=A0A6A6L7S4_HEVBR|nr:hypothetical protein GH714_037420 [Hevea brasiliensis]